MDTIPYVWLRLVDPVPVGLGGSRIAAADGAEVELVSEDVPVSSMADIERDPGTLAGAPDMPMELVRPTSMSPGGPAGGGGCEWGIDAIGASASSFDGAGVRLAVLDTGIETGHPAFAGVSIAQKDFTGEGDGDRHGHGTHCAGTIFGRDVGTRIGVARGVRDVLVGKVLDGGGHGTASMAYAGLRWAADRGAQIVSMSLGFDPIGFARRLRDDGWPEPAAISMALQSYGRNLRFFDALMGTLRPERSSGRQILVFAATGNDSDRAADPRFRVGASLPSGADEVVSVGALARTPAGLAIAEFSNTLPKLCAPGTGVTSAWPGGGLATLDGTSMACPHAAGVAALWWQSLGERASAEMVRSMMLANAAVAPLASGYDHTDVGAGIVRAP